MQLTRAFNGKAPAIKLPQISMGRLEEVIGAANAANKNRPAIDINKPLVHLAVGKSVFFDTKTGYRGNPNKLQEWEEWMYASRGTPLGEGRIYSAIRRLLDINQLAPNSITQPLVQVDFITQMGRKARPRVYRTLLEHGLAEYMDRGLLTTSYINEGTSPEANLPEILKTLDASGAQFYFASKKSFAEAANLLGIGSAYMIPDTPIRPYDPHVRGKFVFDGDGVLWSDAAEIIFQNAYQEGLAEGQRLGDKDEGKLRAYIHAVDLYNDYVFEHQNDPELDGPAADLFYRLSLLNKLWETPEDRSQSPLQLIMATARGHIGQMQALAFFEKQCLSDPHRVHLLSGRSKNPYLSGAILYVEDSESHLLKTKTMSPDEIPQGLALIPHGIKNSGQNTLETADQAKS